MKRKCPGIENDSLDRKKSRQKTGNVAEYQARQPQSICHPANIVDEMTHSPWVGLHLFATSENI
jgi:hypothetical protein